MDQFFIEAAKQIPALGVLAFLVWKHGDALTRSSRSFLDHLTAENKAHRDELEGIGQACHRHTTELTERYAGVVERNARASEESARMMGEVSGVLRKMNGGKEG